MDCVFALRNNAGLIYDEIVLYFKKAEKAGYEYLGYTVSFEKDFRRGRTASRAVRCAYDVEWFP